MGAQDDFLRQTGFTSVPPARGAREGPCSRGVSPRGGGGVRHTSEHRRTRREWRPASSRNSNLNTISKDVSLVQSYDIASTNSPFLACQRGASSSPLACPSEVTHASEKLLNLGLASSQDSLLPPEGAVGQLPSLLGLPEPIILTSALGPSPHVDIISEIPASTPVLKKKRAASASDSCTPLQPKSSSLDRSTPGKLFSLRRSTRLAAKYKGVHTNSILKAQELMLKKLTVARLTSKSVRFSTHTPPAASSSSTHHPSALPALSTASLPPLAANLNPAYPLTQEEVQ